MVTSTAEPIRGPMPHTQQWYDAHRTLVTASKIPAILGRSEYATALDVFLEMTGRRPPFAGNEFTRRGNYYEPGIVADYCDRMAVEVEYPVPLLIHPKLPCLAATPDARRRADSNLVEAKYTVSRNRAEELGEEGTDHVPTDWMLQGQAQMAVTGADFVHFAVFLYGSLKIFEVLRHPKLIGTIEAAAKEMAERVANDDPPEPDYEHEGAKGAIKILWGLREGEEIDLSDDAADVWAKRQEAAARESEAKREKEWRDAELLGLMRGAQSARLPNGGTIRRGVVNVPEKTTAAYSYDRFFYSKPKTKKGR